MILSFEKVSKVKTDQVRHEKNVILSGATFTLSEGDRVCLLGDKNSGVPTVLRLIAGSELPTSGKILRNGKFSPPIGHVGSFHAELTGEENIRFICKLYGQQPKPVIEFIKEFIEADKELKQPMKKYQDGFGKSIAFALSLAMKFDTYLAKAPIASGSKEFQQKCMSAFADKTSNSSLILASNSLKLIRKYTSKAIVVHNGSATLFDDLEAGISEYQSLIANNSGNV